jgi:hypothetical protein
MLEARDDWFAWVQEQIYRAFEEHRYEDIPDLMQQQSDLTVKERRWTDAAFFQDFVKSLHGDDQVPATNLLHSHINMESGWHTASGPATALVIADDTNSAAQRMMEAAAAPAAAPKEQFISAVPAEVKQDYVGTVVPDNLGKGDTSADDYDGFGDMRIAADQFQ